MDQLAFSVITGGNQQRNQAYIVSMDGRFQYFLSDCGKLSLGQSLDWRLSSNPDRVSADAILIKQGVFSKAAVFQNTERSHLMTMHGLLGSDNVITWRSKTYRWTVPPSSFIASQVQTVLVEDSTGQGVACVQGLEAFSMKTCEQHKIFLIGSQEDLKNQLWVRMVVTSGLVAARQPRKQSKKANSRATSFAPASGDVLFVN